MAPGYEPLRQPRHDAGGSPQFCVRPRRAGGVASFLLGHYEWVVCGCAAGCASGIAAEEAILRERRASQGEVEAPFYRDDCRISACASRRATMAAPAPRDHDGELAGATLRQRGASQDAAAAPFYRGVSPRQRRAVASCRPTSPSSPRRRRRRRGTTARHGCGAARSSTRTGSSSLYEPEEDAGPIASPLCGDEDDLGCSCCVRRRLHHDEAWQRSDAHLAAEEVGVDEPEADGPTASSLPGDGRLLGMCGDEDDPRDDCCVRRRLHGDASRRCVRAAVAGCIGSGVKDLAGAALKYAGDVGHSLSAEPDSSMRNGEDIARRNDSKDRRLTLDDSSIVVLIGTPADGGTLVRGGVSGAAKKAAADIFLANPDRNDFMARFWLAIELGPWYWVQEFIDWLKGSQRHPNKWSWLGVLGHRIQQKDGTCAICGTLVCLEARHRLAFERLHGFKTFPYCITTETVTALKNLCELRGVWTKRYGADEQDVLEVIRSSGGCAVDGVPGWNPCRFQVKSWKYHRNSARQPMSQSDIAKLIHMEGPILGGIKVVDDWYYAEGWEDSVYRGCKGASNHLVVCTGYHLLGFEPTADRMRQQHRVRGQKRDWHRYGEIETVLYIEVVDNQLEDGPVRWMRASAFHGFVEVHVETLDATELRVKKPSLWRRLLDTVSRIFRWHGD